MASLKFVFPQLFFLLAKLGFLISQFKSLIDLFLYCSFFQSSVAPSPVLLQSIEALTVRRAARSVDDECAVCLCGVQEDEEIRELKCGHVFHRVCLDRWIGCGHWTCPLCRNHLRLFPAENGHQQILVFNFCNGLDSADENRWWLR